MKKLIKVILAVSMILVSLTACGEKKNEIIGLWQFTDSDDNSAKEYKFLEFYEDGTIRLTNPDGDPWGTVYCSYDEKGKVSWWYSEEQKNNPSIFEYSIENDKLSINLIQSNGEERYCGVYDRITRKNSYPELSKEEIYQLLKNAHDNGQTWIENYGALYVSLYTDLEENGTLYYHVDSDITTKEMLKEYLSDIYTDEVIDAALDTDKLIEKEDGLYTAVYGLGGIGDGLYEVNAVQTEKGYRLELSYCGRKKNMKYDKGNITKTEVKNLVYEDGKYKFAENLEMGLNSVLGSMIISINYDVDTAE